LIEINVLVIDFKIAYDSIHRESLINITIEFHLPDKQVNISISEICINVKVGNTIFNPILVKLGLIRETLFH